MVPEYILNTGKQRSKRTSVCKCCAQQRKLLTLLDFPPGGYSRNNGITVIVLKVQFSVDCLPMLTIIICLQSLILSPLSFWIFYLHTSKVMYQNLIKIPIFFVWIYNCKRNHDLGFHHGVRVSLQLETLFLIVWLSSSYNTSNIIW